MPQQQSRRRILQLLREYPFLKGIHAQAESLAAHNKCQLEIGIKVKRGDPNLMFSQADDVRGGNGHFILDTDNTNIRGTRREYYLPVNGDGELGDVHDWREWKDHYVRDLFNNRAYDWIIATALKRGQDPFEAVSSIVWVTEEMWYPEDINPEDIGSAKPVRINLWITIYKAPKKGWCELYRVADPLVNVKLYGWRLISGPSIQDSFREVVYDRLERLGQEFQRKVWDTGLGKVINSSRMKGMSGQYGNVKVMTYVIAGRLTIQFERGNAMFSLGGLDEIDNPRLGFGSIVGKVPQAEKMVRDVIKFWEGADEGTRQNVHQDDPTIGLGF